MKRNNILALMLAVVSIATMAAEGHDIESLSIKDVNFSIDKGEEARLSMVIDPSKLGVSSEAEMILTPVLVSADSTSRYSYPTVIVAGRNRMLRYERGQRKKPEGGMLYSSRSHNTVNYSGQSPFQDWMQNSRLSVDVNVKGCCGNVSKHYIIPVADIDLSSMAMLEPPRDFQLESVAEAKPKIIELKGSAFIDFRVNRTEIDPAYRGNLSELTKIIRTIDVARENPDATITDIYIKGFASPEGSYQNNIRLAKGRTQALKDYVKSQYGFEERIFHTDFEPEDWAGLRDSVVSSTLAGREGLLTIIDSELAPDAKDAELKKRYPSDYSYLLANIYPALRHSDYVVQYEIKQYTTVEDIRRVMRERPTNLNEHELLTLLSSCASGSHDFDETVETGVRLFPDNRQLQYLYGVMLAKRGEYDEATEWLGKASAAGVPEAAEVLGNLESIMNPKPKVTYIIPEAN